MAILKRAIRRDGLVVNERFETREMADSWAERAAQVPGWVVCEPFADVRTVAQGEAGKVTVRSHLRTR